MMLMAALGQDYIVWDKAASIRYRKPGYTTLYADFTLPDEELASIRQALETSPGSGADLYGGTQGCPWNDLHVVERTVYRPQNSLPSKNGWRRHMIQKTTIMRAALLAALIASPGLQAAEVAGVKVDERIRVGSNEPGAQWRRLRSKLFVKVYVGALAVGQKASTTAAIMEQNGPRRIVMRLLRDMDADTLHGALDEGLRNNLESAAELAEIKPQADQLAGVMKGIGKVREGDSIAIDFNGEGITVTLNADVKGKVAGGSFARALLKVWLGDKPADASLKKALLGG